MKTHTHMCVCVVCVCVSTKGRLRRLLFAGSAAETTKRVQAGASRIDSIDELSSFKVRKLHTPTLKENWAPLSTPLVSGAALPVSDHVLIPAS